MSDASAFSVLYINSRVDPFVHQFQISRLEVMGLHFIAISDVYDEVIEMKGVGGGEEKCSLKPMNVRGISMVV